MFIIEHFYHKTYVVNPFKQLKYLEDIVVKNES